MSTVDLGSAVTLTWSTAPAGSAVAISITAPDGTAATPGAVTGSPAVAGTPVASTFVPAMPGRHVIRWTTTAGTAGAYTDVLDVWPADPRFIISLDDAKNALNLVAPAGGTIAAATLDELRLYIAAVTPVIEDIVGPIIPGTFTQIDDGGGWAIPLFNKPTQISSVIELGQLLDPTAYFVDYEAGILYAGRPQATRRFMPGYQAVQVTYQAGGQLVPPNVRLAARELLRHWWQLGKQGTSGAANGFGQGETYTPNGYAVPYRVVQLCGKRNAPGGFA
jgi:hypothetical protein